MVRLFILRCNSIIIQRNKTIFFLVIAIDLDPKKIALTKKNAEVYGVAHRIDFRVGNFFLVAANLRVDAVVTSPPWGGPGYERQIKFDARDLCGREIGGMAAIIWMARAIAPTLGSACTKKYR
jgi:trimethylguanosine synthase